MPRSTINPFKPSAGHLPPVLIGREAIMDDFEEGLNNGSGAPGRLMRVTGARGVGKTVMLAEFRRIAEQKGWEVISETASKGLAQRLVDQMQSQSPSVNVMNIGGSLGEVKYERSRMPLTLREALSERLDDLDKHHAGLLVTIDEVQAANRNDMVAIATAVQHLTSEDRNLAFVFAGLPSMASKWLNDDVMTFLRRAQPERLGDVPLEEVSQAFADTFHQTGMILKNDALHTATQATAGYPFMIQLVGYHIWRIAHRNHAEDSTITVTIDDAESGVRNALNRLGDTVHGPELDGLSPVDKTYLLAMAQDDGPSSTSTIAERMGKDIKYASMYRMRLIEAQVIQDCGYGRVDFAIPYLRQYLREHAVHIRMAAGLEEAQTEREG
ncbi:ATP-binding protein [Bifidobacterium vespertilionis]|uniref:ATP-binding protein n=1 Tax=Bifidobacterium vespertilionis TaxID=2562524 RepID=UPI001BDD5F62|nr:ATP-binding protein [Bifidobacterium vespertilionis]MBT1180219.1 ATP-binding protein [Bifidobacterium vespertilionis]